MTKPIRFSKPYRFLLPPGGETGLGLSLSYDIIKAHGGKIKVGTQGRRGKRIYNYSTNMIAPFRGWGIKAHGGEIRVETKEGEGLPAGQAGSEFIINLNS